MTPEQRRQLPTFSWMESRIPALDALAVFVLDNGPDPTLEGMIKRSGQSRWYPVTGGHRVLIPKEAGQRDRDGFELALRAWDHEHCDVCGDTIPAMMLCWVTVRDPYVLLCIDCYAEQVQANIKRPWWRFWN
jgi:hypothetical protein